MVVKILIRMKAYSMINAQIKNTIKFPKAFLFVEDLHDVATKFIVPDIQGRMVMEQDLRGVRYPPLAPSTLKRKARLGLSMQILAATGKLRTSIFSQIQGKTKVIISIKPERFDIGEHLQINGVNTKRGKRFFNFFGISSIAEKKSIEYLKRKIQNAKP